MSQILTRDLYKQIKHYDRQQMENFLQTLTAKAYNRGASVLSEELADKIEAGIKKTKGIGEKRYAELIDNINAEILGATVQATQEGVNNVT